MPFGTFRSDALPTVTPHRRQQGWGVPRKTTHRLATGCVLLLGIAGAINLANAQELSSKVQLSKLGLPAIESLTLESDYTVFMAPNVPLDVRRRALRKLWSYPAFNKTDGLLAYAGDYTISTDARAKHVVSVSVEQQTEQAMAQ